MVLDDHKRRGKKLIPPMMELPLHETSWHIERLPELYWLAFIGNRIGFPRTLQLVCSMAKDLEATVLRLRGDNKRFRPYVLSENNHCTAAEKDRLTKDHEHSDWMRDLGPHIAEMTRIWSKLPLAYLARPSGAESPLDSLREEVKTVLQTCISRHQMAALAVQAIFIRIEICTEKMSLPNGIDFPEIDSLLTQSSADDCQFAVGLVVTACNAMLSMRKGATCPPDFSWQRDFWNTCYALQPDDHG